MYESINRFISHPEESIKRHFDEAFGTEAWRKIIGETEPEIRVAKITELYRQQLIKTAHLEFIRTFEMINQGNRTEYFLFFATNSPTGLSKMKEAMWRADPVGGEAFSDRTETDQMVLIQPSADLRRLRQLLITRFRDRGWVSIEEIEKFVLFDTPFSETMHLKQRTLKPLERDIPPAIEVRRPVGKRNRAGEYPQGTRIRFL